MDIHLWQIAALTFLGYFGVYDSLNTKLGSFEPVVAGFITGIIMGDVKIGLTVGGTLQLMMMGVHNYGGSTIPDYMCACIISTAFTIANNQGLEFAVALAIPSGCFSCNWMCWQDLQIHLSFTVQRNIVIPMNSEK